MLTTLALPLAMDVQTLHFKPMAIYFQVLIIKRLLLTFIACMAYLNFQYQGLIAH